MILQRRNFSVVGRAVRAAGNIFTSDEGLGEKVAKRLEKNPDLSWLDESKNAYSDRQVARGALGGVVGTAALAGLGYGAKKLYDRHKRKKQEKEEKRGK